LSMIMKPRLLLENLSHPLESIVVRRKLCCSMP
jgi:hypothetical protein